MASEGDLSAIGAEFIESWNWIERFFQDHAAYPGWQWLQPVSGLITKLREKGYDREFRAGQNVYIFRLSRSLRHGLRDEQPSLGIMLQEEGGMVVTYHENGSINTELKVERVAVTPELEDLLARLRAHPLD